MSAWMITDDHADYLATAYLRLIEPTADPQQLGHDLLLENMRSLGARYGDKIDEEALAAYRFNAWQAAQPLAWINQAAACADYQCCEHDDWEASASFRWVNQLYEHTGGHDAVVPDNVPWGINASHRAE